MALPAGEGAETYDSEVTFGVHHQGGPGIAHGGIVGAALDEACGLLATWHRFPTVTARIAIRYRKPAPINRPLQVTAKVDTDRGRRIEISAVLRDGGELLARSGRDLPARPARALPRHAGGPRRRRGMGEAAQSRRLSASPVRISAAILADGPNG